jgi:hypothetical protein
MTTGAVDHEITLLTRWVLAISFQRGKNGYLMLSERMKSLPSISVMRSVASTRLGGSARSA